MVVLDTHVISELFKPAPDPKVMAWVRGLSGSVMFTTAVTRGELMFGVHCMPAGRRSTDLLLQLTALFAEKLAGHVLPYDGDAADAHAALAALRRAQGRPIAQSDAMIAGIASSRGATLATRNVRDFEDCGVALIDPWH